MAKRFEKEIIIVLVTLFLIVLAVDARPLKSKRLQKLTLSLKRKINFPIDLDRLRFEKAIEVMELFSKRGISLVDARKRNPFLDKVINILDERNKNDPTITDDKQRTMVISSYAQAFCSLCKRLRNPPCIKRYCYVGR